MIKVFLRIALAGYFFALGWILFYQVGATDRKAYFDNPDDHLLPFHTTYNMFYKAVTQRNTAHGEELRDILLVNILGNLVLLLPWGMLAPLVFNKLNQVKGVALSGFLISLTAEVLQFSFSLGVFDIDDLMYNTIGAVFGFYLLKATKYFLWKNNLGSLNVPKNDKNYTPNQY